MKIEEWRKINILEIHPIPLGHIIEIRFADGRLWRGVGLGKYAKPYSKKSEIVEIRYTGEIIDNEQVLSINKVK